MSKVRVVCSTMISWVLTLGILFRLLEPIVVISTGKAKEIYMVNRAKGHRSHTLLFHQLTFCSDEALAVWMLKQTNDFKGATLVRTRDPAKLAECSVVVDVGGVYDPAQQRYDHHQVKIKQETKQV